MQGDPELRLDFVYFAPGEQQAEALARAIGERTDYDVEAGSFELGLSGAGPGP